MTGLDWHKFAIWTPEERSVALDELINEHYARWDAETAPSREDYAGAFLDGFEACLEVVFRMDAGA